MFKKFIPFIFVFIYLQSSLFAQPSFTENQSDTLNKKRLLTIAGLEISSYTAGLSFLSFIWYKDHERVPFHYYNDWKGYLQQDKMGHAYSAYHESQLGYYALRWAGVGKKKALIYGSSLGLLLQTPIEIYDGMYEGWGFSWGDIATNTLGSVLFITQELLFDEQIATMKFSYSPSGYPQYHHILGENEFESFFLDYNGHSYWLSLNLQKSIPVQKIPSWLNFAIGYSANGMIKELENPVLYYGNPFPKLERYRQWLLSFDVDFTRIHTKKRGIKTALRYLNMIKVPFPAIEINRIVGLSIRPLYF
ncbi:DUF2279 domain-containing protein [Sphingobacteriaceae bacterium AH-315-L07]|nr:DUF2279 domain-containing protein [Sphingobacteriaceae bacterium AH-315-L07]